MTWTPAAWYFRPRRFEARVYAGLGVRRFKRYLPTGGDLYANRTGWHPILDRVGGQRAALSRYERRTRLAELAHVVTFLFFAVVSGAFLVNGLYVPAALIAVVNVGLNVYPIMVQRFNRQRIYRLLAHRTSDARGASATPLPTPEGGPAR